MDEHPRGAATAVIDDAAALIADGRRARDDHGDLTAARRAFEAAYREADRAGDGPGRAEAALGLGGIWVHEQRSATAVGLLRSRLEHALSGVDPRSALALRLRARLAAEADYQAGRHAVILRIVDEARAGGDPVARIEALSLAHACLLGPDDAARRFTIADEMLGESAHAGRPADVLMALLWRAVDRLLDGDPHAERGLSELRAQLTTRRHQAIAYVVDAVDVMLAIRAGRFDRAERLAVAARGAGLAAGDEDATAWYGAQLMAIRWFQGRVAELRPMLAELVHAPTLSPVDNSFFAGLAIAAAAAGDRRTASGALAALSLRDLDELPRSSSWLVTLYGAIEAAHLLDATGPSARAYELLSPYADRPMMASLGVACFGSAHHALGVASLTLAELDRAVTHFRAAVDANLALGHWPAASASRRRLAEALDRRDAPGDPAEARAQLMLAAETDWAGAAEPDWAGAAGTSSAGAAGTGSGAGLDGAAGTSLDGAAGTDSGGAAGTGSGSTGGTGWDHAVGADRIGAAGTGRVGPAGTGRIGAAGTGWIRAVVPAPAQAATCTRHGRQWRVQVGADVVLVAHGVGLLHLAVLTANPGVEIAATELVAGVDALGPAARPGAMSAQPVLDRAAVQGYRQRMAQLDTDIDAHTAARDLAAAAGARAEREWLAAELAAGTGLGGRVRAFSDAAELARLAVGKSIRRAIAHIAAADPAIGAHLRDGVHTGTRCWYRPV